MLKLTTTGVINAEEEDDKPRPVAAAASLADRAGEEEPAMSLDREGWMRSKWGEMGDLDLAVRAPPLYTVAKFGAR